MHTQPIVRVGNWNVKWSKLQSRANNNQRRLIPKGEIIKQKLTDLDADILCVTEAYDDILPNNNHVLYSNPDFGLRVIPGKHKVILWSKNPWQYSDWEGDSSLPKGRFILGTTNTPVGLLTVIGVCISWKDANVDTGRKDRQQWEDHQTYLRGLAKIIAKQDPLQRIIVVGDYNQRLPRNGVPQQVAQELEKTFQNLHIATRGTLDGTGKQVIDHLAHSSDLQATYVTSWDKRTEDGAELSDHIGVMVELATRS